MDQNLFTPRTRYGKRLRLTLSDADARKIERGHEWQCEVTDTTTGKRYTVKGAQCGSPHCFCDALVLKVRA
jgi:hypothetical protein